MNGFADKFVAAFKHQFDPDRLAAGAVIAVKILIILAVACIVVKLVDRSIKIWASRYTEKGGSQRVVTLSTVLASIVKYVTYFIAVVMILEKLGVNTTSILASAGIVGLAVGFGAQSLVKDVISGFFIILENQYAVGDLITIGSHQGTVEEVSLRVTRLKGFGGEVYVIPNGQVVEVINHSRGPMRAMVDIGVSYDSDVETVKNVLEEICQEIRSDTPEIKEGPTVQGIVDFGESSVVFRIVAFTEPMCQWQVEREIRRRIKLRFDKEKIEIPFPYRVVINRGD